MTRSLPPDELTRRILALIPEHPEILEMDEPWGLFKIPGFQCSDLAPSLPQASAAVSLARARSLPPEIEPPIEERPHR